MPIDSELLHALCEVQGNLGKTERLARVGAIENDVGHFAAAKRFGGLLA